MDLFHPARTGAFAFRSAAARSEPAPLRSDRRFWWIGPSAPIRRRPTGRLYSGGDQSWRLETGWFPGQPQDGQTSPRTPRSAGTVCGQDLRLTSRSASRDQMATALPPQCRDAPWGVSAAATFPQTPRTDRGHPGVCGQDLRLCVPIGGFGGSDRRRRFGDAPRGVSTVGGHRLRRDRNLDGPGTAHRVVRQPPNRRGRSPPPG